MPASKRPQTNTTFVALITFVGLFIIATTVAVIYYVKAEDHRTKAAALDSQIEELASSTERRKIGALIGTKQGRKSRLGTMVDYLDAMVYLIVGGLPEDTSAEVKVNTARRQAKDTLKLLAQKHLDVKDVDTNTIGLIRIIEKLKTKLDNVTNSELATQEQLQELQNRFDDAMTASFEKEQILLAEKEKYQQQVNDIAQNYDELQALLEQTSERQVQTLMTQLDEEKANSNELNKKLLKTQAELTIARDRMKRSLEKLRELEPPPDIEVAAYKPDGKIILIDDRSKIVHLDIGTDDRVYRGLIFSVYEKNIPIPKDGKGKAEIEVFNVGKNISSARIIRSEIRRPIVLDDIIANLIWDSDKKNVFVVAGEFDLNNDGAIDYDAVDKIKALIEKWGGMVANTVSIDTDFLVLGGTPEVRKRPTFEEVEVDPMAMEKYEASLEKLAHYREVQKRAEALSIPVFNAERFLYFIGYKTQVARPGAF